MVFRRFVKDSAIYGGADFITKLLSFFAFPIIAAALSPKIFGVLELIFTLTALLGLIINCGLNNAVQRYYWDKDTLATERPAVVTNGLVAQIILSILVMLLALLLIPTVLPLMEAEEWPLTWIALVAALIVMVLSQWSQYILDITRLHMAPWRFFTAALVSRVMTMVSGLVAVIFLELGIDGLLAAQAFVLVLVLPLAVWLIRKDIEFTKIDKSWLKKLVEFGYPFIFASLAYWLFGSIDRWMLASMASVEEVGIYSVSYRCASVVLFVSAAFGQAWSPIAIKIRTDHPEKYCIIYGQVLLWLMFVMLVVGGTLALFSGEIISLIMPAKFLSSALPLAILCFGMILQATQQVTAIGISLEKKTYLFAILTWIAALINFIGNWLLIPNFGAVGAAWATLASYLFLTVSYMVCTQYLHPLTVNWTKLSTLIVLGVIVAIVSITTLRNGLNWLVIIVKLTLIFVCFVVGWKLLPFRPAKLP